MPNDRSDDSTEPVGVTHKRPLWMRLTIWTIGGVVAAAVIVTVGVFVYIHFIKADAPAKFSVNNATITTDASITTDKTSTAAGATTTSVAGAPSSSSGGASSSTSGVTYKLTSDSAAGYRVVEVLFGQHTVGVGRTNSITGSITLDGANVTAAAFTVDMTTLKSDQSNRDRQFQNNIMQTSQFPTATFTITKPIALGTIPADNTQITASATGNLTLHGVTKSVTLTVTAKKTGSNIVVAGSTDVKFSDYNIDNPSNAAVTTEDHGLIEFQLVAKKA